MNGIRARGLNETRTELRVGNGPGGRAALESEEGLPVLLQLIDVADGCNLQLADDLVAGLLGVELERLQRRSVVFLKTIPSGHAAPRGKNVVSRRHHVGEKIPEALK